MNETARKTAERIAADLIGKAQRIGELFNQRWPIQHIFRASWGSYVVWCNQYWDIGLDCPHCKEAESREP